MDSSLRAKKVKRGKPVRKSVKIRCKKLKSVSNHSLLSGSKISSIVAYKRHICDLKKNNQDLAVALEEARYHLTIKDENLRKMNEIFSQMMLARFKLVELQAGLKSFIKGFDGVLKLLNVNEKKFQQLTPFKTSRHIFKTRMQNTIEAVAETSETDSTILEQPVFSPVILIGDRSNDCMLLNKDQAPIPSTSNKDKDEKRGDFTPQQNKIQTTLDIDKSDLVVDNYNHISPQMQGLADILEAKEGLGTPKLSLPDKNLKPTGVTGEFEPCSPSKEGVVDMLVDKDPSTAPIDDISLSGKKILTSKIPKILDSFIKTKSAVQPKNIPQKEYTLSSQQDKKSGSMRRKTFVVNKVKPNSSSKVHLFPGNNDKICSTKVSRSFGKKTFPISSPEFSELNQAIENEDRKESEEEMQGSTKSLHSGRKTFVILKKGNDVIEESNDTYDLALKDDEIETAKKSDGTVNSVLSQAKNIEEPISFPNQNIKSSGCLQQFPQKLQDAHDSNTKPRSDDKNSIENRTVKNCIVLLNNIRRSVCGKASVVENPVVKTVSDVQNLPHMNSNIKQKNAAEKNNFEVNTENLKLAASVVNVVDQDVNEIRNDENAVHACTNTSESKKETKTSNNCIFLSQDNIIMEDENNPESLEQIIPHEDAENVRVENPIPHKTDSLDVCTENRLNSGPSSRGRSIEIQCNSSPAKSITLKSFKLFSSSSESDNESISSLNLDDAFFESDIFDIAPPKTYPARKQITTGKHKKFTFNANKRASAHKCKSILTNKLKSPECETNLIFEDSTDTENNSECITESASITQHRKSVRFSFAKESITSHYIQDVVTKDKYLMKQKMHSTSASKAENTEVIQECDEITETNSCISEEEKSIHMENNILPDKHYSNCNIDAVLTNNIHDSTDYSDEIVENALPAKKLKKRRNEEVEVIDDVILKKSKTACNIQKSEEKPNFSASEHMEKNKQKKVKKSCVNRKENKNKEDAVVDDFICMKSNTCNIEEIEEKSKFTAGEYTMDKSKRKKIKKLGKSKENKDEKENNKKSLDDIPKNKDVKRKSSKTENKVNEKVIKTSVKHIPANTFVEAEIHAPPPSVENNTIHDQIGESHRLSVVLKDVFKDTEKAVIFKQIRSLSSENQPSKNSDASKPVDNFPKPGTQAACDPEIVKEFKPSRRSRTQVVRYKEQPLNRKMRR